MPVAVEVVPAGVQIIDIKTHGPELVADPLLQHLSSLLQTRLSVSSSQGRTRQPVDVCAQTISFQRNVTRCPGCSDYSRDQDGHVQLPQQFVKVKTCLDGV